MNSATRSIKKPKITQTLLTAGLAASLFMSPFIAANSTANHTDILQDKQQQIEMPKIQVAILLDTSGSMDGLIDQTRNQLWQMVDEFSKTKKKGVTPLLEVAVYEYGNSRLSEKDGYVRKVTGLTRELDRVSEALFSLTTNGGDEYCGFAINSAVSELQWSTAKNDIRVVFIAGNEPFTQGPTPYSVAINKAKQRDIIVSTLFAGDYSRGLQTGWQQGAILAGGTYMNIDQNQTVTHIVAPQDKRIAELNNKLNQTYLPYGTQGKNASLRQQQQDKKSNDISLGMLAERVKSKVSSFYNNAKWDLVDAFDSGEVDLDSIKDSALPTPMRGMSSDEKQAFISSKKEDRLQLRESIKTLTKERESYIAEEKKNQKSSDNKTVNDVMKSSIRAQAEKKNYDFN